MSIRLCHPWQLDKHTELAAAIIHILEYVTILNLVQFHGVNIFICIGPSKGRQIIFYSLRAKKGTLVHSPVLERGARALQIQQEVVASNLL